MYPSVCLTMLSACVCEGVRERLIIHESLSLEYPKVLALNKTSQSSVIAHLISVQQSSNTYLMIVASVP